MSYRFGTMSSKMVGCPSIIQDQKAKLNIATSVSSQGMFTAGVARTGRAVLRRLSCSSNSAEFTSVVAVVHAAPPPVSK